MPPKKVSRAAANSGKNEKKKTLPEKLEMLEKENKSLKLHVAQLEENFDYKQICTKLKITKENMHTMMQDENAKLRARIYELESSQISSDIKEGADNKSDALKKLEEQPLKKDKDMQELQKNLDANIDELKEELNKKNLEVNQLKDDIGKTKNTENNTKMKNENTAEVIERTTKEIELNKEKEKNIQPNEELRQLETKVETFKKENKDLKTQLDKAHIKISSAAETVTKKKSDEMEKLQKDKDQKDKDRQDMQSKEKSPGLEIDNLKQQPHERDDELTHLKTEVETLRKDKNDMKTQLEEANDKIKNLQTELSSRDGKQIPKEEGDVTAGENESANLVTKLSSRDVKQITKEADDQTSGENESSVQSEHDTDLKQMSDKINQLKSENDDRALTIKDRDEQIQNLKDTLKVIEKLKDELQTKLEAKETTIEKTESEKEILKQDLDAAKKENEKCIKDLNSKLAAAQGKIVELESQLETQRNANNVQKPDHNKVKELEKQIKLNQKNHNDQIKEERESLENELKQKDNEINELNKSLSKYESEMKSLKDKISKLESTRARSASRPRNDELKKAHEEIEELKTRLSKVMGDKITENNPDIADLSDLNRPTKLAERYSELYDNEWTDAFEELENNRMESRQILDELYNILKDVYIFSQKVSYDYDKSVRSSAIRIPGGSEERPKTPNMNSSTRKQLVDLKKTFAPLLASDVFKLYLKKYKEAIGPKTKKFIGVCTEICWLMSVQDPPVVLDIEEPNGRFDKDKYKFYQRSGKQVDFIVWPPMRLHEKGPLLGKGVAEGK